MKRIAWLTDIHLNFLSSDEVDAFLHRVKSESPDVVLVSGDIAEARDVVLALQRMDDAWQLPLYFVLGNHDYYFGSIRQVRRLIVDLCRQRPRLHFLTGGEPVSLTSQVGLVGHDGWADGRHGDYERSYVMMNDYLLIDELAGLNKLTRWGVLKELGTAAAAEARGALEPALDRFPSVYFVTHVPPWLEACWHEGRISDSDWAPHFTCQAMGDMLVDVMRARPDQKLTVLCGHTHGAGETRPLDNIHVVTGGAIYGAPDICRVIEFDE